PALATRDGQMADHPVGDLQHPRDLRERRRSGGEEQQVVSPLRLVIDLVGELAPPPCLVAFPAAAVSLDPLTYTRDDLSGALLGELRVQQQQNLVLVHAPECSFPWTDDRPAPLA